MIGCSFDYVFPIVGGEIRKSNGLEPLLIRAAYGTAFYLGRDCFMTAGHVLKSAAEQPAVGVGFIEGTNWLCNRVEDQEVLEKYDIGIVRARLARGYGFQWDFNEAAMLDDVQTAGFPYALDLERGKMELSCFKGYIVGALGTCKELPADCPSYHLSFGVPRGLSGGPLLTFGDASPKVKGIVIGTKSSEMLVLRDTEVIREGETHIVERYETLTMGLAVQSRSLAGVRSRILGGSVEDHVGSAGLM
jgi:hypothetical protein